MKILIKIKDIVLTIIILAVSTIPLIILWCLCILIVFINKEALNKVAKILSTVTTIMFGVIPSFIGAKPNLSKEKNCIFVANHGSFIDYFLLAYVVSIMINKKKWTYVYGSNLNKYPIFSYLPKKYGLGVDRTCKESKCSSIEKMRENIESGISIAIFPEGTRIRKNKTSEKLANFHNGAFSLACEYKIPIVPVVFGLPFNFRSAHWWFPFHPQKIDIHFMDPVYPEDKSRRELRDEVHKKMFDILKYYDYNI